MSFLIGYLGGLLSFKIKSRWCTACGAVKSYPRCAGWASSVVATSGLGPYAGKRVQFSERVEEMTADDGDRVLRHDGR